MKEFSEILVLRREIQIGSSTVVRHTEMRNWGLWGIYELPPPKRVAGEEVFEIEIWDELVDRYKWWKLNYELWITRENFCLESWRLYCFRMSNQKKKKIVKPELHENKY